MIIYKIDNTFKGRGYRFKILEGNIMIPLNNPRNPSTAIPINLNGSASNQKIGYNINAKIASGQQRINRMIQAMNVNIVKDIYCPPVEQVKLYEWQAILKL